MPTIMTGWKIVDRKQDDRIVQTFDDQADAIMGAERADKGWGGRYVALPMSPGDQKRADHVRSRHER